ncbi:MAG: copper amine oxidase N-terminal domain-containing protein [Oscillospiraceae bacterium]|nr:copper amine oxidase N-terminal domain-containing protein [Oscillospiraceae bacterium]
MKMKRLTRWAAALGMTALLLCGSAFAAGEQTIAVQLNGEDLTFTDAVPQVKDQRTFLPFRAVFEAMGAEVSNEGNVITAKQGDKTLTMTIGETAATVTQLGMEVPITMDVAPYVDNTTWRTYVPVRFAAQAFGYTVGWDQDSYTAILIDPVKVMNEAMEGKEFTYLEKLAEYSEKYNKGIWDMTMDMDGSLTMLGGTMPMSATAKGTTQDEMKMSMDMNMKMDLTEYIKSVSLLMGEEEATLDAEAQAQLDALAQEGIDLSMRGNMDEGKLYMMMGGSLLESAGIPKDTWFLMDFDAIFAQTGLNADWKQLMTAARSADMTPMLASLLAAGQQPATASTAYGEMKAQMEKLVALFADDAFVKNGNDYTATIDLLKLMGEESEGAEGTMTFTLTMRRSEVTGYAMGFHMAAVNEEMGTLSMDMTMSLDDKDQMKANIAMDMGELLNINLDLNAKYTKGRTAPETVPPAGAVVLPLDQMMGSSMGVIGGADGPTTIIVGE